MIDICIPNNHIDERHYIINVLFKEFLGLTFTISVDDEACCTTIRLENNNTLKIEDHFFNKFDDLESNYLDEKTIPLDVIRYDLENAPEKNIIGLFGDPNIIIESNNIHCYIDIIASAFFMLTRWEEYAVKDRDAHGRFPARLALAYKHDFLSRPIVNEYVEILWQWLEQLGVNQTRKKRTFQIINTHDIDKIKLFEKPSDYLAKPIKALLTDHTLSSFLRHTKLAIQSLKGNDPYLVFDYFMDLSEKYNIKSHFFFMSGGKKTKYDNGYDISSKQVFNIIKHVRDRGHIIGIHPSYETLDNPKQLTNEIDHLRDVSGSSVICGRQHYLRFEIPSTWQNWEDNGMHWDSSLGYSEEVGFRCGVCYSYPVFNILTRQTLRLYERPLIIMDATLIGKKPLSPQTSRKTIDYYLEKVNQYSGEFVFLWHNSSFEYLVWKSFRKVYENTLSFQK